jgi:hypothetical protein
MSTMALPPGASTGEDWSDPDENGVSHRAVDWANHWSGDTVAGVTGLQYTTGQITPFISCAFTGRDGNERVIEISDAVAEQIVGVLASCLADWPEPR